MASTLTELFKHNQWANLRLLDACGSLTDEPLDTGVPGTYGTIRDTLAHLIAAEEYYVSLLTSEPTANPLRRGDPFPGIAALQERARRSGDGLVDLADRTDPTRMVRRQRQDEFYHVPAWVVLLQAINHATEHRSQVATILTQQGIEPPSFSGWAYGEDPATS